MFGKTPWNKGIPRDEKTRKKISDKLKGTNHPNYGKKRPEHSLAMSGKNHPMFGKPSAFKGKHHTEEAKRKISAHHSGEGNPFYGKHHTAETREKMSKSHRKNLMKGGEFMDLNIIWFVLIVVLFTGFFILEGFDYGVGMLILGRSEKERSQFIRSIGPIWHGNSVWMITAGGAAFAAFPHFYATMFSTFYLALFLMLIALIMRGVAFELRGKFNRADWKLLWDGAIVFGSFVPALLWGVAIANLVRGLPIDSQMHYAGNFFNLLSPYTILAGIFFVCLFAFHGVTFLMIRLADERLLLDLKRKGKCIGAAAWITYIAFIIASMFETDVLSQSVGVIIFAVAAGVLSAAWDFVRLGRQSSAFVATSVSIAITTIGFFVALFPRLMVSSLSPEWSLTIYNAASTQGTLFVMTIAAVILVPIVLAYQYWTYKTFKERIAPMN